MSYTKTRTYPFAFVYHVTKTGIKTDVFRYSSTLSLRKSRTGDANPKWKVQVKSGTQAGTAMSGLVEGIQCFDADAYRIVDKGWRDTQPPFYYTFFTEVKGQYIRPSQVVSVPSFSDLTKAKNQAYSRLFAALRQTRSMMQAGVTAGEFGESIRGIGAASASMARLFAAHKRMQEKLVVRYLGKMWYNPSTGKAQWDPQAVRKVQRDPSQWNRLHKELRENWLNFSLGLRPLVKDVTDLAKAVAHWNFEKDVGKTHEHTQIRGYGEDKVVYPTTVFNGVAESIQYTHESRSWVHAEVICRAGLLPQFTSAAPGSAHRLYQLLGLYDLENWVPTIWNLLPMSFVVDYVTNVAAVCNALVTDTSNVSWVIETVRLTGHQEVRTHVPYKRVFSSVIDGTPCYTVQGGTLGGFHATTQSIGRTPQVSMSLPSLSFSLPTENWLAYPNLLALFTGRTLNSTYNFNDG